MHKVAKTERQITLTSKLKTMD